MPFGSDSNGTYEWTGRQIRRDDKKGRIPAELAPIMERIGLSGEIWCDVVKRFGKILTSGRNTGVVGSRSDSSRAKWLPNGRFAIAKCRLAIFSLAS